MKKVNLECVGLDYLGRGICYKDNKTYFISNLLPGEEGYCETILEKTFYTGFCKLEDIKKLSSKRSKYLWTSQTDLAHLDYGEQIKFQYENTINTFAKFKLNINKIEPTLYSPQHLKYRNKVTLFAENNASLQFGSYEHKSHNFIENDNITIPQEITNFIKQFNSFLFTSKIRDIHILKLIIRINYLKELMVVLETNSNTINKSVLKYMTSHSNVKSFYLNSQKSLKHICGAIYLTDKIGNLIFSVGPTSFFQVNQFFTTLMYDQIKSNLSKKDNVLDLYSGMGSILCYVSSAINLGLGLEINEEAVSLAREAILQNHLTNIQVKYFNCNMPLNDNISMYNTVIVDPPRAGLSDSITKMLLATSQINKIIYLSCYLPSMCRDLKILCDKFQIQKVIPLRNFPHTSSNETLVILEKTKK